MIIDLLGFVVLSDWVPWTLGRKDALVEYGEAIRLALFWCSVDRLTAAAAKQDDMFVERYHLVVLLTCHCCCRLLG